MAPRTPTSNEGVSGQELAALVTWLQTFDSFSLKIVDGIKGKVATDSVLDALSGIQATR